MTVPYRLKRLAQNAGFQWLPFRSTQTHIHIRTSTHTHTHPSAPTLMHPNIIRYPLRSRLDVSWKFISKTRRTPTHFPMHCSEKFATTTKKQKRAEKRLACRETHIGHRRVIFRTFFSLSFFSHLTFRGLMVIDEVYMIAVHKEENDDVSEANWCVSTWL